MDVVNPEFYVALYPSPDLFEMGLLCYVIAVAVAPEMMVDDYNHIIEKGSTFLKCNYLGKKNLKKRKCFYKMLKKIVYVLSAYVVNHFLSLNDDLSMSAADNQCLADRI